MLVRPNATSGSLSVRRTLRISGAAQPRPLDALVRPHLSQNCYPLPELGKSSSATSGCKPVARAKVLPSTTKLSTITPTTVPPSPTTRVSRLSVWLRVQEVQRQCRLGRMNEGQVVAVQPVSRHHVLGRDQTIWPQQKEPTAYWSLVLTTFADDCHCMVV